MKMFVSRKTRLIPSPPADCAHIHPGLRLATHHGPIPAIGEAPQASHRRGHLHPLLLAHCVSSPMQPVHGISQEYPATPDITSGGDRDECNRRPAATAHARPPA